MASPYDDYPQINRRLREIADEAREPGRRRFELNGEKSSGGLRWDDLEPWAKAYWAEIERLESLTAQNAPG